MKKFYQSGKGRGKKILLVGESPSSKGWRDGYACRNEKGNLLPSGKRLNELLETFNLSVDECGFAELCQRVVNERKELRSRAKKDWSEFLGIVRLSRCRIIILLGAHTTEIFSELSGVSLGMGKIHDIKIEKKKYQILPLYHPSPINPKNASQNRLIVARNRKCIEKTLF
jgi:uracil-DNA glycosylase family 4